MKKWTIEARIRYRPLQLPLLESSMVADISFASVKESDTCQQNKDQE